MDQHTLAAHIHQAAERILFVLPPRNVNDATTTEAGIVMQAARLGLEQAITNARERTAHPDRYTYSDITPFNHQTPTPTFDRITEALAKARRAQRFTGRTTPGLVWENAARVRLIGDREDLEDYGVNTEPGTLGTIDYAADEDQPGWYVDFDDGNTWYVHTDDLELIP